MKKAIYLKKMLCLLLLVTMSAGCEKKQEVDTKENAVVKSEDQIIFSGKMFDGTPIESREIFSEKKVTMVNVWATFCQPCIKEIPELQELNNEMQEKNCQVIGILSDGVDYSGAVAEDVLEMGNTILKAQQANYLNLVCDMSPIEKHVNLDAVPTTFFVDSSGKIIGQVFVGAQEKDTYKQEMLQLFECR